MSDKDTEKAADKVDKTDEVKESARPAPQPKRIRIESDGTMVGTKVIDTKTGEDISVAVSEIRVFFPEKGKPSAWLKVVDFETNIEAPTEVTVKNAPRAAEGAPTGSLAAVVAGVEPAPAQQLGKGFGAAGK